MSVVSSPDQAQRFVEKWKDAELSERAASHEHFIDLCRLVGQPTPAEADPIGQDYCFEKPVNVALSASKGSEGEAGSVDARSGEWCTILPCPVQEAHRPDEAQRR